MKLTTRPRLDTSRLAKPLTAEQQKAIDGLLDELRPGEHRDTFVVRPAGSSYPWPEGTVRFVDGTARRWWVEPNGTYTWETR